MNKLNKLEIIRNRLIRNRNKLIRNKLNVLLYDFKQHKHAVNG